VGGEGRDGGARRCATARARRLQVEPHLLEEVSRKCLGSVEEGACRLSRTSSSDGRQERPLS